MSNGKFSTFGVMISLGKEGENERGTGGGLKRRKKKQLTAQTVHAARSMRSASVTGRTTASTASRQARTNQRATLAAGGSGKVEGNPSRGSLCCALALASWSWSWPSSSFGGYY